MAKLISIIIPVLNEASGISAALKHTLRLPGKKEVLVVDGGSTDGTPSLAAKYARVITAPRGRTSQMNAAAEQARGEALLFLHSDTLLPQTALADVEAALSRPGVVGGAFRLKIDDPALLFRFVELGSNARARFLKIFFGDQGIFCLREAFFQAGGYPPIPLMEDWEFSRALQKEGRMALLPSSVTTSARRWRKYGVWRTIFLMHRLKLLYRLGVPAEKLAAFYERGGQPK